MRTAIPPLLREGDTIGIAAPASAVRPEDLAAAIAYLERRGFRVCADEELYGRERFLSGPDDARAAHLNALFADPAVKGIFIARGGYGSARLLERLDWAVIEANPKLFVGFSDTTALQVGLLARAGLASVSGLALKMDVGPEGMDPRTEQSLWSALMAGRFGPAALTPVGDAGPVEGALVGGCLSLVVTLLGTPFEPTFEGCLVYLEDVGEAVYRIDRMLNHLRMAGVFGRAAGVVFGQFHKCPASAEDGTVEEAIGDLARRIPCPVFRELPYGHGPSRCVMPMGGRGRIEKGGRLEIEDWRPGIGDRSEPA